MNLALFRGQTEATENTSICEVPAGEVITSAMNPYLFPDETTNTQMTWDSANDIPRTKGTVKLLSQVTLFGNQNPEDRSINQEKGKLRIPAQHPASTQCHTQQQQAHAHPEEQRQPIEESVTDDSGSRIVEMLSDFEKQMNANLQIIQEDNAISDGTTEVLSELQDMTPRRVKSEDDTSSVLTPHKARKLQRILHKARKEVKALRDNSGQCKSEIEQMEEYKSELKLIEDRTKHQLAELRSVYQVEIDKPVLEKDAAIIEAGRQAARYAESGNKASFDSYKAAGGLQVRFFKLFHEKLGNSFVQSLESIKEAKNHGEGMNGKNKIEPGIEILPDAEPSARRKRFLISRSFARNKELTLSQKDSVAVCATHHLSKESDSKKDSSNIMPRSIRRLV